MAVIEQLVFGPSPRREKGREVLGSSPGISRDCAQEVVRLCEGWGAVPAEGLRRPALLCFPLSTRLSSLHGELHVVVRVAAGLRPIYHALVLARTDFQDFDLNPFALAQEEVFLDQWQAGEDLPRRELRPGSLAPLVSPPPGQGDVGFAVEAVRQMLANQRLLLPLERASSDSEPLPVRSAETPSISSTTRAVVSAESTMLTLAGTQAAIASFNNGKCVQPRMIESGR